MEPTDPLQVSDWVGLRAVSRDGEKIGRISDVYLDDATGQPEWLAVRSGLFGSKVSFVPVSGASENGDVITLPYSKAQVRNAPRHDADGHLSPEQEATLYRHYGFTYDATTADDHDDVTPDDDADAREDDDAVVNENVEPADRVVLETDLSIDEPVDDSADAAAAAGDAGNERIEEEGEARRGSRRP